MLIPLWSLSPVVRHDRRSRKSLESKDAFRLVLKLRKDKKLSKISKIAEARILDSPLGEPLLELFRLAEQSMIASGTQQCFHQFNFNIPGDALMAGEFMPTLHISLAPAENMTFSIAPEEDDA